MDSKPIILHEIAHHFPVTNQYRQLQYSKKRQNYRVRPNSNLLLHLLIITLKLELAYSTFLWYYLGDQNIKLDTPITIICHLISQFSSYRDIPVQKHINPHLSLWLPMLFNYAGKFRKVWSIWWCNRIRLPLSLACGQSNDQAHCIGKWVEIRSSLATTPSQFFFWHALTNFGRPG